MSNLASIEMEIFDSLPREFRDLVNEFNSVYDVYEMYCKKTKIKDARSDLEYIRDQMQESQLAELVRRAKKMKSTN